jgi:hypothetical protein
MEVYHLMLQKPLWLHYLVPFFLQQLDEKLQLLQQTENCIVDHHRLTFNFTSNPLLGIIYGNMSAAPDSASAVPAAAVAAAPAAATSSFRP